MPVMIGSGNGSRFDPLVTARQQFALAVVATKRDRVEERYSAWQSFAERFAQFRRRLAGFRGKAVPYVGGVLDVAFVVVVGMTLGSLSTLIEP